MKKRERAKKIASYGFHYAVRSLGVFLYITGLTLAIPLTLFIQFPDHILTMRFFITLVVSVAFVSAGFFTIYMDTVSFRQSLRQLSYATLIPVAIAIVVSFYSVNALFATAKAFVPDFELIRPLVDAYVETKVPRIGFVVYAYAIAGLGLLYASYKVKK